MRVVLILGTNLGNRLDNLKRAEELIRKFVGRILRRSPVFETPPFGVEKQPPFLNYGLLVETHHPPFELLRLVKWIEKRVGRYRTFRWGPRVIDVDIVKYGDVKISVEELQIPHPGLKDREFFRKICSYLDISVK
ncbi:2-amino-4-hydroxy-6-hydroxymethyldihydropteridine diphosphokinase [Phorcysia thermohydrogeniphila]|uniref:2-amino-4-hydroxy-6-hydroxymethyldihydropteridine pyrophosphokinase n=1 Tax=Phorcysia thermohydrogeniphila TaxID=936138 RepID=A0A4R1GAP1_9BACT|nr:2-amino-4-hydroxy-6-hydroxymethyldihydropteridine diphosphokinase [Phorcysia thermohydrogeniphila]TCK05267.1 2-amino-4-hydroxy-6-hydroxymethyldihydropteridine diphosphokinase [Phorcysia thermohydrogeniphila]